MRIGRVRVSDKITFFLVGVILSVIAAILWEIFELFAGLTVSTEEYSIDTIFDLIAGFVGAALGSLYSFSVINKYE